MFKIETKQFLLGGEADRLPLINKIISHYKDRKYSITEYVKSNTYNFEGNPPLLLRQYKIQFNIQLISRDQQLYACISNSGHDDQLLFTSIGIIAMLFLGIGFFSDIIDENIIILLMGIAALFIAGSLLITKTIQLLVQKRIQSIINQKNN